MKRRTVALPKFLQRVPVDYETKITPQTFTARFTYTKSESPWRLTITRLHPDGTPYEAKVTYGSASDQVTDTGKSYRCLARLSGWSARSVDRLRIRRLLSSQARVARNKARFG